MSRSTTDRLIANAERHASSIDSVDLPASPAGRIAVLTCMDSRIDIFGLLGLEIGEAHVLRNAGGVVTEDAIRSLSLSQHVLGTEEIILIHHTDCGLLGVDDEEYAAHLEDAAGKRPRWRAHGFEDLEQDVRDGAEILRSSPFVPHTDAIRGFVYEVETGRLREVALG